MFWMLLGGLAACVFAPTYIGSTIGMNMSNYKSGPLPYNLPDYLAPDARYRGRSLANW